MTDLRRHVPPVTLTWDAEAPGTRWRAVAGTLVFADVSGFTAVTERLSRRGRIGAEQIVDALNSVFAPMLRIADERGGELLKFGGDALLFLFRGEGHAEQACDAAVEMRASLRATARAGGGRTGADSGADRAGRLPLSMSVGIHSGDVHLFLVGAPTRELVVLGPAATATAQAEKAAEAGQIVVSPATAARLPSAALRARDDGQLLLRRRRAATGPAGARLAPQADPALLATLFPTALGAYLAPRIPDPEHRLACIAFVRCSGTDRMLEEQGPDALASALHVLATSVQRAADAEQVTLLATDLDADGAKFFLGAGLPTAFEDNEGRMLRAMRQLVDSDPPLPLQVGVNAGHVFAAEVGIAQRGAYTGMGDTTNTAARIMAKAPAGTIYAHPAVLEHSRTRFAAVPAGPFSMKGKSLPLTVFAVGEELGARPEAAADERLPLLGRDSELAAARAALAAALDGAGGVVSVVGATGLGKTRLARAALAEVAPDHVLVVRFEPYGSAAAYRAFRDPVRHLLGIERGTPEAMGRALLDALARVAPELLGVAPLLADLAQAEVPMTRQVLDLDPRYRPDRLAEALVALIERTRPGRVVIAAEEAHWADAASASLLARLGTAAEGRPWAVLAILRPEAAGFDAPEGTRVELGPLPREVIEQLVIAATAATPLRPHEVAAIVDRAEGNPLFVEEVTRVAVDAGSLQLPESVGAAMGAQIDLLPAAARRVLRYCAVLGRSFRMEVLRAVLASDGEQVGASELTALRAHLVADGPGRMRFRNSLVRDAAYEGLAYRRRAAMHRTTGQVLEQLSADLDADAAMLALHFWLAGDTERTWRYAQRAGADARRAHAVVDAAAMYERALEAGRRLRGVGQAELADLWSELGDLRELSGHLDDAVAAYRRAAALTADPVRRAGVMARRARVHSRAGAPGTSVRVVAAARRLLAGRSDEEARRVTVRLDHQMAVARLGQARLARGRHWALRAAEAARALDDTYTLIRALLAIDVADQALGRPGVGEHTREALQIAMATGDRPQESVARANLGVLAFYAGRWQEATQWLTSSSRVAMECGNDYGAAETDLTYADILTHQGRLDEAEQVLADAFRVLKASGIEAFAAHAQMLTARIHLARGDAAAARDAAAASASAAAEADSAVDAFEAVIVQAQATIDLGAPAEALALIEAAHAAARDEGGALMAPSRAAQARAWLALGDLDAAGRAIDAGLAAALEQDLPYERAVLLRLRRDWRLRAGGDPAAAAQDETQAAALMRSLGARA